MDFQCLNFFIFSEYQSSATIILDKCLIHPGTIIKVQSLVEDSIEAKSFLHLSPHLPDVISGSDVETFMGEHIFKTKHRTRLS